MGGKARLGAEGGPRAGGGELGTCLGWGQNQGVIGGCVCSDLTVFSVPEGGPDLFHSFYRQDWPPETSENHQMGSK